MLNKVELQELRGQITLNSLYTSDYHNSLRIEEHKVSEFFDGYASYLEELIEEDYPNAKDNDWFGLLRDYDTIDNLWSWYCNFEEDPLPRDTDNMWVCEHCLEAIESREGNLATMKHYVDEDDEIMSRCDWCEEVGFDILYELV
jgi:hypothetical protein